MSKNRIEPPAVMAHLALNLCAQFDDIRDGLAATGYERNDARLAMILSALTKAGRLVWTDGFWAPPMYTPTIVKVEDNVLKRLDQLQETLTTIAEMLLRRMYAPPILSTINCGKCGADMSTNESGLCEACYWEQPADTGGECRCDEGHPLTVEEVREEVCWMCAEAKGRDDNA